MNYLFGTDGCKHRVRDKQCDMKSLAFLGKPFIKLFIEKICENLENSNFAQH